jgi:hypothetical protein
MCYALKFSSAFTSYLMSIDPIANVLKRLSKLDDFYDGFPKNLCGLLYIYLMMSMGIHGSLSLPFMMKVMFFLCFEKLS